MFMPALSILAMTIWPARSGSISVQQTPPPWMPTQGEPPLSLAWNDQACGVLDFQPIVSSAQPHVTGRARYDLHGKRVVITWSVESPRTTLVQEIATSYWPTSAINLANKSTLVVAGKRKLGNTVIESWEFLRPKLVTPPIGSPYLKSATQSSKVVYDEAAQGRDIVRFMVRELGQPNRIFVQFNDSSAVNRFDLGVEPATHSVVAVASGSPGSALLVPRLADSFTDVWSGNHLTRGYAYVFLNSNVDAIDPLVLLDANRDAQLDSWQTVTGPQWSADGWADSSNYGEQ